MAKEPAFLDKLYTLLHTPAYHEYIEFQPDGQVRL